MGFRYYRPALHVMSSFSDRVRDAIACRATASVRVHKVVDIYPLRPYHFVRSRIVSCETVSSRAKQSC